MTKEQSTSGSTDPAPEAPPSTMPLVVEQSASGAVQVVDLSDEPIEQTVSVKAERISLPDKVRSSMTFAFIILLAFVIVAGFAIVVWKNSVWDDAKELLDLILPAITALLGSAVGFYFGSQTGQK